MADVFNQDMAGFAAITVRADERDEHNGNASHEYTLIYGQEGCRHGTQLISFQRGPLREAHSNGVTNEALLAIVRDRLEGFQSGRWACAENAEALGHISAALNALESRTAKRAARGVEGTSAV